ncbi:hypothetical protein V8E53_001750 [Lactarius tabidus]
MAVRAQIRRCTATTTVTPLCHACHVWCQWHSSAPPSCLRTSGVPTHNHSGQVVKLSYARARAQQQRHAPEHQERLLGHSLPRDWVPHSVEVHLYSFAPWFSLTQQDDSTPRESSQSVEAAAREDIRSFLALPCPLLTVFVPSQISASWITALPPHPVPSPPVKLHYLGKLEYCCVHCHSHSNDHRRRSTNNDHDSLNPNCFRAAAASL